MPSGGETGHVRAGLGDDHLGDGLADSGDGGQLFKLAGKRAHLLLDPGGQLRDRRRQLVDTVQTQSAEERVMLAEVPGERFHK
jgi:hypothetical protein